jgi:hypothetical protein
MSDAKKALFICTLVYFAHIASAHACSCAIQTLEQRFEKTQYAFSAKIIAGRIIKEPTTGGDQIEIELGPHTDHKGDSSHLKFLYTMEHASACGITVKIGRNYTFLVNENGRVYRCGSVVSQEEWLEFLKLVKEKSGAEKR